ncbi:glycosyltransferase family 39 protein [bacterium]|nr:glycosyltransferase family 39 protein [bacterium]
MRKSYVFIILLLILILGGFFRLWKIKTIPCGLYPDEAINGNEALLSLKNNNFKVFYPENNGREGLYIWLIAISFKIFGIHIWSIRIVSAIIGIFTILGMYLLVKALMECSKKWESWGNKTIRQSFSEKKLDERGLNYRGASPFTFKKGEGLRSATPKAEWIALLSAFFLAISFWHINFSRIGFRAILVPFCLVWGIYFLLKGLNTSNLKSILSITLAGIFFGLGFYTYIAFRIAILIPFFLMLYQMKRYWPRFKAMLSDKCSVFSLIKKIYIRDRWWYWDLFFIVVILVALPLGIYFFQNPSDFISRASGISVFATENSVKEFIKSTIKTLAMFNFYGDSNWRHNYSGSPMMNWSIGILFIIGFIISVIKIIKAIKNKTSFVVYYILITWFALMLLPAVFTAEGIPHAIRTIGVIPVIYIFASLGFIWFMDKFQKALFYSRKSKLLFNVLLFLLLFQPSISNFNKYFFKWAKNSNVKGAFRQDLVDMGNYINSLPSGIQKYIIVNEPGVPVPYPNGIPMPSQTIIFIQNTKNNKKQTTYLKPEELDKIEKKPSIVIPIKYDEKIFEKLKEKFPNGKIEKNSFVVFEIE